MASVPDQSEFRQAQRSNTLIGAQALAGNNSWSVRIRNLSVCGALVESDVTVDVSASIILKRGQLQVSGKIAWRREGLFGVKFFEPLALEQWIALPTRTAVAPDVVRKDVPLNEDIPNSVLIGRLSEEIGLAARMIGLAAETLSEDPILRMRHAARVQELCMGQQMLVEISAVLTAEDKHAAIKQKATGSMRNRLLR